MLLNLLNCETWHSVCFMLLHGAASLSPLTRLPFSCEQTYRPLTWIRGSRNNIVNQMFQISVLIVSEQQMPAWTSTEELHFTQWEDVWALIQDNMDGFKKGYYKSVGTHHFYIVNEFVVIWGQISGADSPQMLHSKRFRLMPESQVTSCCPHFIKGYFGWLCDTDV